MRKLWQTFISIFFFSLVLFGLFQSLGFAHLASAQAPPPTPGTCGGYQCGANDCGVAPGHWAGGYWPSGSCSLRCEPGSNYSPNPCGGSTTITCPPGTPYQQQNICFSTPGVGCIGTDYCFQDCGPSSNSCFQWWETNAWCSGGCTPTPTPNPSATPTPTPTGGGGPTPTPAFSGSIYLDANAVPGGIGGTDNLCVGSTSTVANANGSSVRVSRAGENRTTAVNISNYSITTSSTNSDYTVALELPFPPADPDNPLQCACNADPTNPYRCVYTNRTPNSGNVHFFVKQGAASTAWFQILGGSAFASGSIESKIPFSTCSAPGCIAALITRDTVGTVDSAGFPLTQTGSIVTSDTGGVYIHEASGRSNALQAEGLGVRVPVENYNYFFNKFGGRATTLANAIKPIAAEGLQIYRYSGNMVIDNNNPWNVSNTEQVIVFVDGNLIIDDEPGGENRLTTVAGGGTGFLMFMAPAA